jgi:hypothetical protein
MRAYKNGRERKSTWRRGLEWERRHHRSSSRGLVAGGGSKGGRGTAAAAAREEQVERAGRRMWGSDGRGLGLELWAASFTEWSPVLLAREWSRGRSAARHLCRETRRAMESGVAFHFSDYSYEAVRLSYLDLS